MHVAQFLGLVALPLAAAMPAVAHRYAHDVGTLQHDRAVMVEASQFNFSPFNLTNLGMECSRPSAKELYSCELRFDWHDPNSAKQNSVNSCSCIYKWSWNGKPAVAGQNGSYTGTEDYTLCYKEMPVYFEMRIATFNASDDFSLEIAHRYHDSENFTAPWDYPMTFAQPQIHLPCIEEKENLIRLYDAGPILANITAVSD